MPALITLNVDDRQIRSMLDLMHSRLSNLRPFFVNVGEEMVPSTRANFNRMVDPTTGASWQALKPSTVARKRLKGRILRESGQLQDTIRYQADGTKVVWGTDKIYGAIHQLGGKTKAHLIKPVRKKALAWPGGRHPVRAVNHPGSNIPARPYLGVSWKDRRRILDIAEHFLRKGN